MSEKQFTSLDVYNDSSLTIASEEYKTFGKYAEFLFVYEGFDLKAVSEHPDILVSYDTIRSWAQKLRWFDKRQIQESQPMTVEKMAFMALHMELVKVHHRQARGETLELKDVTKLEKLVKIHKNCGFPFVEMCLLVMKSFIRYVEKNTKEDTPERFTFINIIKNFMNDVETGYVKPPSN